MVDRRFMSIPLFWQRDFRGNLLKDSPFVNDRSHYGPNPVACSHPTLATSVNSFGRQPPVNKGLYKRDRP